MKETINNLTNVLYDRYTLVFMYKRFDIYKSVPSRSTCVSIFHSFRRCSDTIPYKVEREYIHNTKNMDIVEMGVLFIIMEIHRKSLTLLCCMVEGKKEEEEESEWKKNGKKKIVNGTYTMFRKMILLFSIFQFFVIFSIVFLFENQELCYWILLTDT